MERSVKFGRDFGVARESVREANVNDWSSKIERNAKQNHGPKTAFQGRKHWRFQNPWRTKRQANPLLDLDLEKRKIDPPNQSNLGVPTTRARVTAFGSEHRC